MTQNAENDRASIVANCDATECRYNQEHECHAGQIQVGFSGAMAVCQTYTPRNSATGMGENVRDNSA